MSSSNLLDRKIYFYRVTATKYNKQINSYDIFDRYSKKLNKDYIDLRSRKLIYTSADDRLYFLDIVDISPSRVKGIFYLLRNNSFPYLFNMLNGNKDEIPASANDALMEQTHFIIYPDIDVIVAEYNHFGPRLEKINWTLKYALEATEYDLDICPIILPEFYKKIIQAEEIKSITFKVGHLGLRALANNVDMPIQFDFDDMFNNVDQLSLEFTISGGGSGINFKNKQSFLNKLVKLIKIKKENDSNVMYNETKEIKKARMRANTELDGKILPLDLLDEKLLKEVKVLKDNPNSKYVNSKEMFELIETAYTEKYNEFLSLIQMDQAAISK